MKPNCVILIGLPGSGKSTWIKDNTELTKGHTVISSDNIIEDIAKSYGMTYDEAFPDVIAFASRVVNKQLIQAVKTGESIIIDRTNLSDNSRKKYLNMFKRTHNMIAVVFEIPDEDEHNRRLNSREGKTIPAHILQNMRDSFQEPLLSDYDAVMVVNTF